MKKIKYLFLLLIISQTQLGAQTLERYYDYNEKFTEADKARFYATIDYTDSGWVRHEYFLIERKLKLKGLYKDSSCTIKNGYFYYFHPNQILQSTGKFVDNSKQGLWLSFHDNKLMSDSTVYDTGEPIGTSLQWHNDGALSDSTVYNADGSAVAVSWFDNATLSSTGRLGITHKYHGKWQFFHRNGNRSAIEIYDNGRLVDRKYFDENGVPMTDTTDKTAKARFPGGISEWVRHLGNMLMPGRTTIPGLEQAVVTIRFTINEKGEIKDIVVQNPYRNSYNDNAIRAIRSSPKWIPAMDHNRKVKQSHMQRINFNGIVN